MDRRENLERFYSLLEQCATTVNGPRRLKNATGYMDWPTRGVYFFLAAGEYRMETSQRRCVRVGTHGVSRGSNTTLWSRLKQHYGTGDGSSAHPHGGNHRGSVFRKRVGGALIERHDLHDEYPTWDSRWATIERDRDAVRDEEYLLERWVSAYIRELPFLWVKIDDEPGPESDRAYVERNAIALLSNYQTDPIDPRDECWLGRASPSPDIRESGLWNVNHVEESYDPAFLDRLEQAVDDTESL
ncbi:MAG: hypothetical protein U5K37_09995 [Natrialbaceae archaeon]|nr:hypothetical protein [Natrialbaceae archaeon]